MEHAVLFSSYKHFNLKHKLWQENLSNLLFHSCNITVIAINGIAEQATAAVFIAWLSVFIIHVMFQDINNCPQHSLDSTMEMLEINQKAINLVVRKN